VKDFDCGTQVYDGHGGEDSLIRSFREQAIGVPVFAAAGGRVAEIQNYYPDDSTAATAGRQGGTRFFDNHVVLDHGQTLVAAPFVVVAAGARIVNRPPAPVSAEIVAGDVLFCRVSTTLAFRDPDDDLVRYRYRWTVAGRVVRDVTSAALSDAIPEGSARPGDRVVCRVTPSDGRAAGTAAVAIRT
jgi:hypothetical protein